jgi:dienelactone hydrolase
MFGPFRLYAELARRLADDGFVSLRFDLGGIGDSPPRSTGEPLAVRTEHEIRAAVDHLATRHRFDGVVVGGLCSGAADAFRYATGDERVRGVVMVDPFGWPTSGAGLRYLALRAAGRGLRALGVYQPIGRANATTAVGAPDGRRAVRYKYMEHDESAEILSRLVARKVGAHFVYTGGMRDRFNHPRQLQAMFPGLDFHGCVTVDHFPRTDHTQLLEEDRRLMIEAIARRLATRYSTAP